MLASLLAFVSIASLLLVAAFLFAYVWVGVGLAIVVVVHALALVARGVRSLATLVWTRLRGRNGSHRA